MITERMTSEEDWKGALTRAFLTSLPLPKKMQGVTIFVFYKTDKPPFCLVAAQAESIMANAGLSTETLTISVTRTENPEVNLLIHRGE